MQCVTAEHRGQYDSWSVNARLSGTDRKTRRAGGPSSTGENSQLRDSETRNWVHIVPGSQARLADSGYVSGRVVRERGSRLLRILGLKDLLPQALVTASVFAPGPQITGYIQDDEAVHALMLLSHIAVKFLSGFFSFD